MNAEDTPQKIPFSSRAGKEERETNTKDDLYGEKRHVIIHEKNSEHWRKWDQAHSRALYLAVSAVGIWGVMLIGILILPVWWKLLHGDMKMLSDEVWIVIITAPLLAVSGLSWATIHALSGKKNLPAINTKAFATLGSTSED